MERSSTAAGRRDRLGEEDRDAGGRAGHRAQVLVPVLLRRTAARNRDHVVGEHWGRVRRAARREGITRPLRRPGREPGRCRPRPTRGRGPRPGGCRVSMWPRGPSGRTKWAKAGLERTPAVQPAPTQPRAPPTGAFRAGEVGADVSYAVRYHLVPYSVWNVYRYRHEGAVEPLLPAARARSGGADPQISGRLPTAGGYHGDVHGLSPPAPTAHVSPVVAASIVVGPAGVVVIPLRVVVAPLRVAVIPRSRRAWGGAPSGVWVSWRPGRAAACGPGAGGPPRRRGRPGPPGRRR